MTDSIRVVLAVFVVLTAVSSGLTFGVGTAAADSHDGPMFKDCTIDDAGNIESCIVFEETVHNLYPSFTADNARFWVQVTDIEVADDEKAPHVMWLWTHGYDLTDEDRVDDLSIRDVNTSRAVLDELEQHSQCTLEADVASHGEIYVETDQQAQEYNDEPEDADERHTRYLMRDSVTVQATDVRVTKRAVYCQFDMTTILNQGLELDGTFQQWSGRKPVLGDEIGSMGDVRVVFSDSLQIGAGNETTATNTEGEGWIEGLIDATMGMIGGGDLVSSFVKAIFAPFLEFAKVLLDAVVDLITFTPDVHPNEPVENLHRQTLIITYLLSGLVFMLAGLLYMIGPILGFSYAEVRLILPRLVVALLFASVSLHLLQYAVELTQALTEAFTHPDTALELSEIVGLSSAVIVAAFVDAWVLLFVVLLFIIRAAYILFVAAISPLLALLWVIPRARRYADTFIAGWFAALAMAPADVLVLNFALAVFSEEGHALPVDNWILGMGVLTLLLVIPWQLYGASQAVVLNAYMVTGKLRQRYRKHRAGQRAKSLEQDDAGMGKRGRQSRSGRYDDLGIDWTDEGGDRR